jgi:hypothetical protein
MAPETLPLGVGEIGLRSSFSCSGAYVIDLCPTHFFKQPRENEFSEIRILHYGYPESYGTVRTVSRRLG